MENIDPRTLTRPHLKSLRAYVPGEQSAPGKTIKLNTNENPYPPSPKVIQAITEAASGNLNRYPDPMANGFRSAAARTLGLPGPDWILAGNGSDEILTLLVRGFVGEGEFIRLPTPSYILYRTLAEIQAADWQEVPFTSEWELPSSFWEPAERLKMVMLPNPNSPSGTVIAPDQIHSMADRLNCMVLVDEAYVQFHDQDAVELVKQNPRIVVSRTFSKAYGLAGIRFGYLVAHPGVIEELSKIKDSYNCDAIAAAAATAAILDTDWLNQNVEQVIQTRQRLASQLTEFGFDVLPSHANFVWCTHPSRSHEEIYKKLKASQILIRYMKFDGFGDGLRISVGTDPQTDALLAMIKRMVSS